jgi:hypothetical protein
MAAGNVADFVSHDTCDLPRMLGAHQETGVDEEILSASDKSIQPLVLDDVQIHGCRRYACGIEERIGHIAKRRLNLGIADQIDAALRMSRQRRRKGQQQAKGDALGSALLFSDNVEKSSAPFAILDGRSSNGICIIHENCASLDIDHRPDFEHRAFQSSSFP